MTTKFFRTCLLAALTLFSLASLSHAQLMMNLGEQLQIPGIKNIQSSDTHLYALSETEGMVVFRAYSDSLQWLYSSTGMQERGHIMQSDIRFAYLYGNNRRLTVIEPTSVLGVYSSTILPARPLAVERLGLRLFVAMGNDGLAQISLESPESVDSEVEYVSRENNVLHLAGNARNTLYVLKNNNTISIYDVSDEAVQKREDVQVGRSLNRLFLLNDELIGADQNGTIFLINSDGNTRTIGRVNSPVERLRLWNDKLIVRTENHELWTGPFTGELELWKSGSRAGNYFTVAGSQLWVAEYNTLAPVVQSNQAGSSASAAGSGQFRLKAIPDVVLPAPRPLILPVEFESSVDLSQVSLSYTAPFDNARIRGKTLYWQPSSGQTGRHNVTITATTADGLTDSTSFVVDLRPFNAPPRFSPSRAVSIPVGEEFELGITANDPDGMDSDLIRYLGVDMPDGSRINEQTGEFTWTPNIRQVGRHTFEIIATDQFGAASSQEFTINVIELEEEELDEDEIF